MGWQSFGISAEIAALVVENMDGFRKTPLARVALPDCPAPANQILESVYYPTANDIVLAVRNLK